MEIKNFTTERKVYLINNIDGETLKNFETDLNKIITDDEKVVNENYIALSSIDKKLADYYKDNVKFPVITLNVTNHGGYVLEGLAIYDILRNLNNKAIHPVECEISGHIGSMATFIVLGCDVRKMHENTSVCVHSIGTMEVGKIQEHRDNLEEMERLSARCHDIYFKHTKLTKEQVDEIDKLKKDWWFDAEDALKYGFATEII